MITSEPASSDNDRTRTPVSTRPPNDSSILTIALDIAAEPPTAAGQPKVCAAVTNAIPTAEEATVWKGRKAWAARPENRARALGVRHRHPTALTGSPAKIAKFANFSGCAGTCSIGRRKSSVISGNFCDSGPKTAREMAAPPPSVRGWEYCTCGHAHCSPREDRSSDRENAVSTASGWIPEQWSCVSPGRVSSPERVPPPGWSAASRTVTARPAPARVIAAASP